mgnify:CR=1 FL=1
MALAITARTTISVALMETIATSPRTVASAPSASDAVLTGITAFGRENYSYFGGLSFRETQGIAFDLAKMIVRNPNNVRPYIREEIGRYRRINFFREARLLVKNLSPSDIGEFHKVGIRSQLMNRETGKLEMDFVIENGPDSLHVLNAVSPAFTSAFAIAPYLVDRFKMVR